MVGNHYTSIFLFQEVYLKINSYNLGMESARQYTSSRVASRSIFVGSNSLTGGQFSPFSDAFANNNLNDSKAKNENHASVNEKNEKVTASTITYSDNLEIAQGQLNKNAAISRAQFTRSDDVMTQFQKLHQLMVKSILELLFGRRSVKSTQTDECIDSKEAGEANTNIFISMGELSMYEYTEIAYTETESVSFDTQGTVKTADGREINVNLSIAMSRSFSAKVSQYTQVENLSLIDPLVINFDNAPADLTDMKFFFDLDSDGQNEEISKLSEHSGWLALDKNNDGIINDGSELFGTSSGDGYKDLAAYDTDKNGWIDENDEIFDNLKIWVKDNLGNDELFSLKDKGIGAIYLGSSDTDFKLADESNSANGFIRKTGIFLYENGDVGTTQHVDLVS